MKPSTTSPCYDYYFEEYGKMLFATDLDWRLFKAQAMAESQLNPEALSPVGAMGVMQLMPDTATGMAQRLGVECTPWVPHINIHMGIGYDRRCWNIFKAETGLERVRFMLGAYNAGPGNIIKAQRLAGKLSLPQDKWQSIVQTLPQITGRKNAIQTIDYVARIERYFAELTQGGKLL